jgi:hypothetical protein
VDDTLLDEGKESIADLFKDSDGLQFREAGSLIEVVLEIRIAKFLDNVVVVAALHDIQHAYHVLRLQQLQDPDLREEGRLQVLVTLDWVGGNVLMFFSRTLTATVSFVWSCSPRKTCVEGRVRYRKTLGRGRPAER